MTDTEGMELLERQPPLAALASLAYGVAAAGRRWPAAAAARVQAVSESRIGAAPHPGGRFPPPVTDRKSWHYPRFPRGHDRERGL